MERQKDRKTVRQRNRETERQKDIETERQQQPPKIFVIPTAEIQTDVIQKVKNKPL